MGFASKDQMETFTQIADPNTSKQARKAMIALTQELPCSPVRGVSYTLRPHPWRVVVCVWSVVVLNNSAPSLAAAGWLQDQCCDRFYD